MGVPWLWPLIKEKGYKAQLTQGLPRTPPTPSSKFRVDLLASFYPQIRYHYLNDPSAFSQAIERHLISCELRKETSVLYLVGIFPVEKQHTNGLRKDKRNTNLAEAKDCIRDMENHWREVTVHASPLQETREIRSEGAFYLDQDSRMVLATYLRRQSWTLPKITSEADVAITRAYKLGNIIVSGIATWKLTRTWRRSGGLCHGGGF